MTKKEQVGLMIKTMRLSRNLTQKQLADKLGQTQSSITMYETGRREPDFETLEALADIFNVSMSDLVPQEDNGPSITIHVKNQRTKVLAEGFDNMSKEAQDFIMNAFALANAMKEKET